MSNHSQSINNAGSEASPLVFQSFFSKEKDGDNLVEEVENSQAFSHLLKLAEGAKAFLAASTLASEEGSLEDGRGNRRISSKTGKIPTNKVPSIHLPEPQRKPPSRKERSKGASKAALSHRRAIFLEDELIPQIPKRGIKKLRKSPQAVGRCPIHVKAASNKKFIAVAAKIRRRKTIKQLLLKQTGLQDLKLGLNTPPLVGRKAFLEEEACCLPGDVQATGVNFMSKKLDLLKARGSQKLQVHFSGVMSD